MASFVITSEYVALNGTDYSAYVKSCTLEATADTPEFTTMTSAGAREHKQGLKAGTLNIEFNQDFAASAIDSVLWGFYNTGTNVTFEIRPTSAAVSATNPKFTGSVVPAGYTVVGGAVGDAGGSSVAWPVSGAITRATA